MILGLGQMYYVRTKSVEYIPKSVLRSKVSEGFHCLALIPDCGYCPPEKTNGDYCEQDVHSMLTKVRGWPLNDGGTVDNAYWKLLVNLSMFILVVPLITYLLITYKKRSLRNKR